MKKFLIFFIILNFHVNLIGYGGNVPSPYPSNFMMGIVTEYFVDNAGRYGSAGQEVNTVTHWMRSGGGGENWDIAYRYLTGGFTYGWYGGWNGTQNGAGWTNYLNLVANGNPAYIPVGIYYQINQVSSRTNNTEMGKYYQDWTRLMTLCDSWLTSNPGKSITIDVEPDFAGYVQQGTYSSAVSVASATGTGFPNLSGFSNDFYGYSKALLYIKDQTVTAQNRSRLIIAFHVSGWAQSPNPASQSGMTDAQLQSHANAIASFISQCQPASGSRYDIFFTDPSGYDGEGPNGSPYNWDSNGAMLNQYAKWLNYLSTAASLRGFLWQVPIGNSHCNNVPGHYRDKRPEYFLANTSDGQVNGANGANLCLYVNSGIIGILFGRGGPPDGVAGTGAMDMYYPPGDGYNTVTQDGTAGITNHWVPGTIDDDGGFLRSRIVNKTTWALNCPIKQVTQTNTSTPTATRTNTVTSTNTVMNTATSTRTNTITNTATNTSTNTPSLTNTVTNTATSTRTNTITNTATNTSTNTPSPTNTVTSTRTNTITNTATNTSTNTPTPTNTGTNTATSTRTNTITNTATNTNTNTPTPTNTGTNTATNTSTNTPTSTNTATSTETVTGTQPPTGTYTNTATQTNTFTYINTATNTPVQTNTSSHTPSFSATQTNTLTPGYTATFTFTQTNTSSSTVTFTQTQVITFTPTLTPVLTFIPTEAENFEIINDSIIIYPQPYSGKGDAYIKFRITKNASEIKIRIYTVAFRFVKEFEQKKQFNSGENEIRITEIIKPLANGTYYYSIEFNDRGILIKSKIKKFIKIK